MIEDIGIQLARALKEEDSVLPKGMQNQKIFFVLGGEGNGTYMLANALVKAGCAIFDTLNDVCNTPKPFNVIRRSLPHAGEWIDLSAWFNQLRTRFGFDNVNVLFIVREPNAASKSVEMRDPTRDFRGLYYGSYLGQQRQAFHKLTEVAGLTMKLTYLTYEAFIHSEGFRRWLFEERLQLPYPEDFEVTDQNRKYYE